MILKDSICLKEGVFCYKIDSKRYLILGDLYYSLIKFNKDKFYYKLNHKLNINNKIFIKIYDQIKHFNNHDIYSLGHDINQSKRIISSCLKSSDYSYKRRFFNYLECPLFKYYRIIECLSKRLYKFISFRCHIILTLYLFNLNTNNNNFNELLNQYDSDDIELLLD